jgi:hypothetical protein
MPTRTFILKDPTYRTQQRIQEVRFWLAIQQIKQHYRHNIYLENIIENLSMLFGCKVTDINYAIENLETYLNKPTPLELGLVHHYAQVQIRTICKIAHIANQTVYQSLREYVDQDSYELTPKMSDDLVHQIIKFNKGLTKLFDNMSHIVKEGTRLDRFEQI